MIGKRIKLKRQANGLSLQELADMLEKSGLKLTRTALSNYETDKTIPNPQIIDSISCVLGTFPDFFFQTNIPEFKLRFFSESKLFPKKKMELISYIYVELEKYIQIMNRLNIELFSPEISRINVTSEQMVEQLSRSLRLSSNLGMLPISSVCNALESNGWLLVPIPEFYGINSISGIMKPYNIPFIAYTNNDFADTLRFTLLQQAGYYYLAGKNDELTRSYVDHFSRTFLLPQEQLIKEFGSKRNFISRPELTIIKRKYGIARTDIMKLLDNAEIIPKSEYQAFYYSLLQHGYPRRKRGFNDFLHFYESPTKLDLLAQRALSEKLITPEESNYLLDY